MIFADSSVWIDYLRGTESLQTERLDLWLGVELIVAGDLILTEVLQGFVSDHDFRRARKLMLSPAVVDLAGGALQFKPLRTLVRCARGITVRKTTDVVIATYCIENRRPPLYSNRDFDPFVAYVGLPSVVSAPGVSAREWFDTPSLVKTIFG